MDVTVWLYLYGFPSAAMLLGLGWMIFLAASPRSVKTHISAWLLKRGKVLVYLADDAGRWIPHLMRGDMEQGIFTAKGLNVFVNRPTEPKYVEVDQPVYEEVVEDGKSVRRQRIVDDGKGNLLKLTERVKVLDLDPAVKEDVDHMINHRVNLDTGLPVFVGYASKCAAIGPQLLRELCRVDKKSAKRQTYAVDLIDPRILSYYIPQTWSPSLINALEWKAKETGYWDGLGKRQAKAGGTNWLIVGLLILGAGILALIQFGVIKIPGVNS